MRRIDTITAIMTAITNLVKEAYFLRNSEPHKFKLRNHYISEALGLHTTLVILRAYDYDVLQHLELAIQHYDIYSVQHIMNTAKVRPYNSKFMFKSQPNYIAKIALNSMYGVSMKGGSDND